MGSAAKSVLRGKELGHLHAFGKKCIDEMGMLWIGEDAGMIDG